MAYDQSKDEVLKSYDPIELKEGEFIVINVCSWNGGAPKIAFLHMYQNRDGETRTSGKIPRLPPNVAVKVAETMAMAAQELKEQE